MSSSSDIHSRKRVLWLDAISGLLILFMIYCHLMYWTRLDSLPFHQFLLHAFTFYMAWFFFKGGLFAKNNEKPLLTFQNSINRLIVPFVFFAVIGFAIYLVDLRLQGSYSLYPMIIRSIQFFLHRGSFYGNLPLWFLLTLFFVRMLFSWLVRFKFTDYLLALLVIVLYFLRYLDVYGIGHLFFYPYYLYNTIIGLAFYWLGYRLRQYIYNRIVLLISICCYFLLLPNINILFDFRSSISNGDFILFFVFASASSILAVNFFRWLFCHPFSNRFDGLINPFRRMLIHFGKKSMFYFCTHWILITILHLAIIFPFDINNQWLKLAIYIIGLIILLPLTSRLLAKIPIRL